MSAGLTDQGKKRLHEVARRHVGDEQVPGLVALVAGVPTCTRRCSARWPSAARR